MASNAAHFKTCHAELTHVWCVWFAIYIYALVAHATHIGDTCTQHLCVHVPALSREILPAHPHWH